MWSGLSRILGKLLGRGSEEAVEFLLPSLGDEKLSEEYSHTQELEVTGGPVTAREAFELAEELIADFEPGARLTKMESKGPLDEKGRALEWIFLFHLPKRWGKAIFYFDTTAGAETVRLELKPFVAAGSTMAQMVNEGRSGFVEQQWKVELERHQSLPRTFVDSTMVMSRWLSGGGSVESLPYTAILRGSTPPLGSARWALMESPTSKKSLYSVPIE